MNQVTVKSWTAAELEQRIADHLSRGLQLIKQGATRDAYRVVYWARMTR